MNQDTVTIAREFYITGGTLGRDSPCYVIRKADSELYEALKQGNFCYVLTARQMGKSSLMVRTAARLREEAFGVVLLDLTTIGQNLTAEQWYGGLLNQMGQQLDLEEELEEFWEANPKLGPLQRWIQAVRQIVLPCYVGPVVIFIDEIDSVRSLPFSTDEFFAGIRAFYNQRPEDEDLERLTFCLLGVASPSDLIRDTRMTPFNIGRRIELQDFTEAEAASLAQGLRREEKVAASLLRAILYWTGGHPYLTQRLCLAVAENAGIDTAEGVDRLCEEMFFSLHARERDDNLLFVRERMLRSEVDRGGLLTLYAQVHRGRRVRDHETNPLISVLRLSGITRVDNGFLKVRNPIYGRVFDRQWIHESMPDAELRRQRSAYRRGVIRATAVWTIVILLLSALSFTALDQARRARRAEQDATEKLWGSYLAQARAGRWSGRAGRRFESLEALAKAAAIRPTLELRNEAIACFALADLQVVKKMKSPSGSQILSFDGKLERYFLGDETGSLSVRQVADNRELLQLQGPEMPAWLVKVSPNDEYLAAKYQAKNSIHMYLWDLTSRRTILKVPEGVHDSALEFSPDSRWLAAGEKDGTIRFYDAASGKEVKRLSPGPRPYMFSFDPSGRFLAVSSRENSEVQVWDLNSEKVMKTLPHPKPVKGIDWHSDGKLLASGCDDFRVHVWDMETGKIRSVLEGQQAEIPRVFFSRDGDLLLSQSWDGTTRLWEPWTGRLLLSVPGALMHIDTEDKSLAFSTGFENEIWNLAAGRECRNFYGHFGPTKGPLHVDFSPDGRLMASTSDDGVRVWDTAASRQISFLPVGLVWSALFHPSGEGLITSEVRGVHRWPIRTGSEEIHIGPPVALRSGWSRSNSLSPDGRRLAVMANQDTVVLDLQKKEKDVVINGQGGVGYVAMSPDARWVATAIYLKDGVKIWDALGEFVRELPVRGSSRVCFSPDGTWLVTGTAEEYRFWEVGSWHLKASISRERGAGRLPGHMCFTKDGKMLAIAHSRYVIKLIDTTTMQELATLEAPDASPLTWLCFSPDGSRLAATAYHRVILWDLRQIREQLAAMNLDWNLPPYPTAPLYPQPNSLMAKAFLGTLQQSPK
jgi:WD40 repeat protein